MRSRLFPIALVAIVFFLAGCLAGLLFYVHSQLETTPETAAAPTIQTTETPATVPTTQPPTEAATEAPTEPTVEPGSFLLSFAGDCTFSNVSSAFTSGFRTVIGEDYAYPFADVAHIFAQDDCSFVNLECVLSERGTPADKQYLYRGKPEYAAILTQGNVEFAGTANNHSFDYGRQAYEDTLAALDAEGVHYARQGYTRVFTTESGLTIGVYSDDFSEGRPIDPQRVSQRVSLLKQQGAELIIANLHWGTNYYYAVNDDQRLLAHAAVDAGAHIVYGHHAHVLQPIEEYNGSVIFYSLGNFSYGGNRNPPDKDTAIIQQEVLRGGDGTVTLGQTTVIPCYVSGILSQGNDYQPCPIPQDAEAYSRVLQKLDGSWPDEYLYVSYRPELYPK